MPDMIQVGNVRRGLVTNPLAFNIDNDAFPTLVNAYQWRGRILRKRGTSLLGRLHRFFNSTSTAYSSTSTFNLVAGAGNLLTGFSLQSNGNIVPGSVIITDINTGDVYTDPSMNGTLTGAPAGSGTINYATGAITIVGGGADAVQASFLYYPDLPVEGLEELSLPNFQFPGTLAFDTTFSYNISTNSPYSIYDVSFYKNPSTATYSGYTAKTTVTPLKWNGNDYQQFWSTNYQGAFWVTNGIANPFDATKVGMQFKQIVTTTIVAGGPPAQVSLQIVGHGLVVGDFVFINEVVTTTGINLQTGYVTTVTDANNVIVTFPNATIATNGTGGIAQYLTSNSNSAKDCIRWYDGDPTNGNPTNPTLNGHKGWVNFMPPLSNANYPISDLPAGQYYLVTARMMLPFKDRLLFFGPVIQTSSGTPQYLQDTIIWSEVGTPYYTASFTLGMGQTITSANVSFNPILVPDNQTAIPLAWFEDVTGFGGFKSAGLAQNLISVIPNEDVLLLGFSSRQVRLIYNGNDIDPFDLFTINSEFGTQSTFSVITLDRGGLSIGNRGIILTSQVSAQRIDLDIPDQIFQFNLTNNGSERTTAQRDFINEWIYFTYLDNESTWIYPNQTLQYNYRDNSWAIFNESYTTYGQFRRVTGETWATIGNIFPTWASWNQPWNSGTSTLLQPQVIGGNQQGFVLFRDDGTDEGNSLYIQSVSGSTITSPNHGLNSGDFIIITGALGTISQQVNGKVFQIQNAAQNTFNLNPAISSSTYLGNGVIRRLYIPFIQTKQFPTGWSMGRKTRLGPQQYLFSTTDAGQIELQIYLSQNANFAYNFGPIVPTVNSINNSLIYSDLLYTCPESTNLGLTPANVNLNLITANDQQQTWHRMNTSLLGDTVQIGFTISKAQMFTYTPNNQAFTITGATQVYPCVLTANNSLATGQLIQITGVLGMTQLNFVSTSYNYYYVLSANPTSVTIDIDSSAFSAYISGGTITPVASVIPVSEVELHGFLLSVSPSQVLA